MNSPSLNTNNNRLNFKGMKLPDCADLRAAKRFLNCGYKSIEKKFIEYIQEEAPKLIADVDGEKYILDDKIGGKILSGFKSFIGIPLDIIDFFAKKFPKSFINNSKFLEKYRNSIKFEDNLKAFQGMQRNAIRFTQEVLPEKNYPTGECTDFCRGVCNKVNEKFNNLLNVAMSDEKAVYDTKKERFWARIVSGFTAAVFIGNDFYNKSIQQGKTDKEAKKEKKLKLIQEIHENICEALVQFSVFACFSQTVNKSIWGSALIGTAIGLVSRTVSRVSSGMPIKRIKVSDKKDFSMEMNEYIKATKENNIKDLEKRKQETKNKNNKKPFLSLKNILLFCGLSIAGGYLLRFLKGNTAIGKNIVNKLAEYKNKINGEVTYELYAEKNDLEKMKNLLNSSGHYSLYSKIDNLTEKSEGTLLLGRDYKTRKIFGIKVKEKDLRSLKFAPLNFVKELISYPYKIVSKLEAAIRKVPLKNVASAGGDSAVSDKYGIKNIYKIFMEFKEKYGNDEKKLNKEFVECIEETFLRANNNVTSSSCDNSKIAVLAQTLGALSGMWFNMNDEFNSSIRNGATKYEAQKDARLRGINKFFRMTVQLIISGSLNNLFKKQYNKSIGAAAMVVAISTILTDSVARILTGMPFRKMNKEELEKYQKEHKEGIMSGYYRFIDKLAS